jgi:hypothetical protein
LGLIITAAKFLPLTSTSGPPTGEAAACDARLPYKLPSRGGATHAHFIPPAASTTTPSVLTPPPPAGEESRRPGRLRRFAVSNLPSSPESALASPAPTRAAQVPLASPSSRTLIRVAVLCAWDFGLAGVLVSRVDVCSAWGARGVCGLGRCAFFCGVWSVSCEFLRVSDAVVWFGVTASGGHILGFRCFVSFGLHAGTNGGELVGWICRQTWKIACTVHLISLPPLALWWLRCG